MISWLISNYSFRVVQILTEMDVKLPLEYGILLYLQGALQPG